ncbi:MAG TPA: UDP-2,3-diacylglucosamine diphosphatase, partial [Azospira sp.]|nr:UDP-2,3-diacylglucosamine diphosphatase [Azospira sp.]
MLYFISDLHLSPAVPGITALFLDFLASLPGRQASGLYILGDFFDHWVGDDDCADPYNAAIIAALRQVSDQGIEISLLHGNRDFLLGPDFAQAAGLRLLPDPYVLSVVTWQFVLSHGDILCTDDTDYQAFRAQVRGTAWQSEFLAKPLTERKAIAAALRQRSEAIKAEKREGADYLMDVNGATVEDFLRDNGYATLTHGHTHRPDRHDHIVDGIHCERWVLSDWRQDQSR